jgi:hypothetical protein
MDVFRKTSSLFRFALLMICFLFIHQISTAGDLIRTISFNTPEKSEAVQLNITNKFFTSEIPLQSGQLSHGVEAEVESSEDDIHHNLADTNNNSAQNFLLEEFIYTAFIKSRYLRLVSSNHEKAVVPYFVLYHSWKNYCI